LIRTFTYITLPLINVSHTFQIPSESIKYYSEREEEISKLINDLKEEETIEESENISYREYLQYYLEIYKSLQHSSFDKINLRLISSAELSLPQSENSKLKFERSSSFVGKLKSDNNDDLKKGSIHFHMHG
jgi:hypothetical protein